MQNWYLIRTKPNREQQVSGRLEHEVAGILLPLLKTDVRRWGQLVASIVPLFPCYLFAQFDFATQYRLVKFAEGVRELATANGEPLIVPPDVITLLKRRCANGPVELPRRTLQAGNRVLVKDGPFRGVEAVFDRYMSGSERVAIFWSALENCSARIVLKAAEIEPLDGGGFV